MNIIFSKKDHRYTNGDVIFTSVSKKISQFKNEFDREFWALYKALEEIVPDFKERKKEFLERNSDQNLFLDTISKEVDTGLLSETLLNIKSKWDNETNKSIAKGNLYHSVRENLAYSKGHELNPFDKKLYEITIDKDSSEDKTSLVYNLYELKDGYYPELIIWNDKAKVAGQADKVFIETVGDKRYVDIDDWKTNKQIKTKGFKGQKMKAPLSHLHDCNFVHYNLQISFYAWMLEQFGFYVRNLSFHHYNQMYKLDYLKNEIESII